MRGVVKRRSWKTTLSGVGTLFAALGMLATAAATKDVDLAVGTVPAVLTGIGLLFARDTDVSSEDAGIK